MNSGEFHPCTECECFVWCEFGKQIFHATTKTACDEFKPTKNGDN